MFTKVIHPFDKKFYDNRYHPVFMKIEINEGVLTITGVEGPRARGNCWGGAGQIDMEYKHRNPQDDDTRYFNPVKPSELRFMDGWNTHKWYDFLDIWSKWHLNDIHAECEHQRVLGWKYEDHHNPETFKGDKCPTCGYEIGSAWLRVELPNEVIQFLMSLPETDKTPAWV